MIIQHSTFEPSQGGHGGNRRTAQISEMLKELGSEILVLGHNSPNRSSSFWQLLWSALLGLSAVCRHPRVFISSPTVSTLVKLGFFKREFRISLQDRDPKEVVLVWESTIPAMFPIIKKLARSGVTVVAFPHNVEPLSEALSQGNYRPSKMLRWLNYELNTMSLAKKIVCISPYDSWFYSNWGLATSTWPYEIGDEMAKKTSAIQVAREESVKDTLLILGTSSNEATRHGIGVLLDACLKGRQTHRVAVVSAAMSPELGRSYPNVNFFPNLPQQQFDGELIRAVAIIVFQNWGTGQLTRIHEAHKMGIPVYGNELSGRGYDMRSANVPDNIRDSFPGIEVFCISPRYTDHGTRTSELREFFSECLSPIN